MYQTLNPKFFEITLEKSLSNLGIETLDIHYIHIPEITRAGLSEEAFYNRMERVLPDLILLDIMLPDRDGLEILKDLRARVETRRLPIIMVTAKTTEIDKVKGLDMGADDYLTKPFGVMELISRVKALMRRTNGLQEDTLLQFQELTMDLEKHRVSVQGEPVELTFKEFELLRIFMQNAGIVLQRETLMNKVWGTDYEGESRTLDMHIKTLRQKIGDYGNHIKTVRNVGYRLE